MNKSEKHYCDKCHQRIETLDFSKAEEKVFDEDGYCKNCGSRLIIVDELSSYYSKIVYFLCLECDTLYKVEYVAVSVKILKEEPIGLTKKDTVELKEEKINE